MAEKNGLKLPLRTICEALDQLDMEERELLIGAIMYTSFLTHGGMDAYVAKNNVTVPNKPTVPFYMVAAFGPRAKQLEEITHKWVIQGVGPPEPGQPL
jgi:hypothetical protein